MLVVRIGKTQGNIKVILPGFVDFIPDEFGFVISGPRTFKCPN